MKKFLFSLFIICLALILCLCGCSVDVTSSDQSSSAIYPQDNSSKIDSSEIESTAASKDTTSQIVSIPDNTTSTVSIPSESSSQTVDASSQQNTSSGDNQNVSSETVIEKSENNVEFIGRFSTVSTGVYQFEWSGSTITAGFEGSEISVILKTVRCGPYGEVDYFNVTIDNKDPYVLEVKIGVDKYQLASGLENGYHTVKVTKRTEAAFGSLIQFEGFDYGTGKAAPAPARKDRRIEIYGDSISAGYGNEGTEAGFRLNEENVDLTYGALAAAALNAEYTDIALSGHGIHVSLSTSTTEVTPKYFNRALYKTNTAYRFNQPDPDVVIINLGTNDYAMNVSEVDYYNSYMDFIATIRKKYPQSYIVCTTCGGTYKALSILQTIVEKRQTQYNDNKIGVFAAVIEDTNGAFGSDGHPSVYGHQQLSQQLIEYLQDVMNW